MVEVNLDQDLDPRRKLNLIVVKFGHMKSGCPKLKNKGKNKEKSSNVVSVAEDNSDLETVLSVIIGDMCSANE